MFLEIHGAVPAAKGSVSAFPIQRKSGKMGAVAVHSTKSKDWEHLIRQHLDGVSMITGPVDVMLWFFLPRPMSAKREYPAVRPDLDKLIRAVGDALQKIAIEDDARIVNLVAFKRYAQDEGPGVAIEIKPTESKYDEAWETLRCARERGANV